MPLWLAMSERVHRESNLDKQESLCKLGAPFDSSQVLLMPLWLAMSERVHRESNLDKQESLDKLGAPFDSSHSITDTFSGLP
jgi:hypothetical protein